MCVCVRFLMFPFFIKDFCFVQTEEAANKYYLLQLVSLAFPYSVMISHTHNILMPFPLSLYTIWKQIKFIDKQKFSFPQRAQGCLFA